MQSSAKVVFPIFLGVFFQHSQHKGVVMPITIVKEKKQRQRSEAVAEALETLGDLVTLQKLSVKMEKGTATPAEKRQLHKIKLNRRMWSTAERRYEKASVALEVNGNVKKPTRSQSARKAWATRRAA
jgi:hypothetical protein